MGPAGFTEIDLDEATGRLTRLAACYRARLSKLTDADLDALPHDRSWTLRQLVHHVAHVNAYADMLIPDHHVYQKSKATEDVTQAD